MLNVTVCACWSGKAEGAKREEPDWLEKYVRGNGKLGWTGDRCCLSC